MPQKSSTFAFQYSFLFVMKVLQLGKFYPLEGGVEKTMFDLLTGLASKGVQCDMLIFTILLDYYFSINHTTKN